MRRKSIISLIATMALITLFGCGNKTDNAEPVTAQIAAEETETEEDSEPVEKEEPEPEPVEKEESEPEPVEEEEPEEDEDKALDLDSLENLKWVIEALVALNADNDSYIHDLYLVEKNAISAMLWYMDYCGVENPKGEDIRIGDDENGWDGYTRFTMEQVQEVMNSLTGQQVDLSSVVENGVIDISGVGLIETISECKNWNTEYIGNNIWKISTDVYRVFDNRLDDDSSYKMLEFTFTVTENPDSIFDGYSIIEVDDGTEETEEASNMSEWAKAYYDYLLADERDFEYYLIYLDNDDIPELFGINYGLAENVLIYYSDGQVKEKNNTFTYTLCQYIPKSGLFMEEWSDTLLSGTYGSNIYRLTNGELTEIIEGQVELKEEYQEKVYTLNGETVSEEEYNKRLNEVFDNSKAIELFYVENSDLNIYTVDSLLNMFSSQ